MADLPLVVGWQLHRPERIELENFPTLGLDGKSCANLLQGLVSMLEEVDVEQQIRVASRAAGDGIRQAFDSTRRRETMAGLLRDDQGGRHETGFKKSQHTNEPEHRSGVYA
jgi:hypothetical protein